MHVFCISRSNGVENVKWPVPCGCINASVLLIVITHKHHNPVVIPSKACVPYYLHAYMMPRLTSSVGAAAPCDTVLLIDQKQHALRLWGLSKPDTVLLC